MTEYSKPRKCIKCFQPWNGWDLVCNDCKRQEQLEQQNDLVRRQTEQMARDHRRLMDETRRQQNQIEYENYRQAQPAPSWELFTNEDGEPDMRDANQPKAESLREYVARRQQDEIEAKLRADTEAAEWGQAYLIVFGAIALLLWWIFG